MASDYLLHGILPQFTFSFHSYSNHNPNPNLDPHFDGNPDELYRNSGVDIVNTVQVKKFYAIIFFKTNHS